MTLAITINVFQSRFQTRSVIYECVLWQNWLGWLKFVPVKRVHWQCTHCWSCSLNYNPPTPLSNGYYPYSSTYQLIMEEVKGIWEKGNVCSLSLILHFVNKVILFAFCLMVVVFEQFGSTSVRRDSMFGKRWSRCVPFTVHCLCEYGWSYCLWLHDHVDARYDHLLTHPRQCSMAGWLDEVKPIISNVGNCLNTWCPQT